MRTCAPPEFLGVLLPLLILKGGLCVHLGDAANSRIVSGDLSSGLGATKKETVAWPRHCTAMPEGVAQVPPDQHLFDGLCCSAWRLPSRHGGIKGFLLVSGSVSVGFLTAPPRATCRTANATCLQKHISLNSSLFLFIFTK